MCAGMLLLAEHSPFRPFVILNEVKNPVAAVPSLRRVSLTGLDPCRHRLGNFAALRMKDMLGTASGDIHCNAGPQKSPPANRRADLKKG